MIDTLISTLAQKFGIDESLARQAIGMVMQALNKGGEGDLASELSSRIPGLGDLAGGGGGGLMGGLMGAAGSLLGGGGGSPLSGLSALLGEDKMADVTDTVSGLVAEETDEELGDRMRQALSRIG